MASRLCAPPVPLKSGSDPDSADQLFTSGKIPPNVDSAVSSSLLRKQPGLVPAAVNPASISTPGLTSWKILSAAWVQRFNASFVRRGLKSCSKMQAADVGRRQGRFPRPMAFDCVLASLLLRLPRVRGDFRRQEVTVFSSAIREEWIQTLLRLASSRRQGRSPQPMAFDCAPPVCCSDRHASGKNPRQVTGLSSAIQCFISRDVGQTLLQLASSRRQGRTTRPLTFDCAPPVCCSGCHASGRFLDK